MKPLRSFLILCTFVLSSPTFAEPPQDDATTKWIARSQQQIEKMRELDRVLARKLDHLERRCGPIAKLTQSNHCLQALAEAFAHKLPKPTNQK